MSMKKIILILLGLFALQSCVKDDTDLTCMADCTTIQGQLVTAKGEPLQNIPVALNYHVSYGVGAALRKIKETKTDQNGNYSMQFYIKDDELGASAEALFELMLDYGNLDPEVYMDTNPYYMHAIYSIPKRDTTMTMDFYNPKKAFITVNLSVFNPIQVEDYLKMESFIPFGLKIGQNDIWDSEYAIGYGTSFKASSPDANLDSVIVAESDYSIISIRWWKNGVGLMDQDTILFIPENNKIELNFTY